MVAIFDRTLNSARRRAQAARLDLQEWAAPAAQPAPGTAGPEATAVALVVEDVISQYAWMEQLDRMFRETAGNARPNPEAEARATVLTREFAEYVRLADAARMAVEAIPVSARPPAARLAELARVRQAADELAQVYEGEASYFGGDPGVSWEELRAELGV